MSQDTPLEIKGDRIYVDTFAITPRPRRLGVPARGQAGSLANFGLKRDIRARLWGLPDGIYDILRKHRERAAVEEAERTRLYGPPINTGVDGRGTPPTRAERRDPRWKIGTHWSGLPQRIIGVVGLPRPGQPKVRPEILGYKGPHIYYWPTDTADTLMREAIATPVGWRMTDSPRTPMCSMDLVPPPHPHVGFWYDTILGRLGEVYDPTDILFWGWRRPPLLLV
jgi:hypothetical protein